MTLYDDFRTSDVYGDSYEAFRVEPTEGYLVVQPEVPPVAPSAEPWMTTLRRSLERSQGRLKEREAARELGFCTRTLQRHLRSRGTTFRAEARAARERSLS